MKRKLVRQGPCTLMMSVPRDWAQKLSLKKGSDVEVEERGPFLLVSPAEGSVVTTVDINVVQVSESAIRIAILNAYRCGFSCINVKFRNDRQFELICRIAQDFVMGLDVNRTSTQS